jgi:PadR family transcriptional regulator, regulatory protein PadR
MPRSRNASPQTRAVLAAFLLQPAQWQYGFTLSKLTGQQSGTLYPILARLAASGLLESAWEQDAPAGRPTRHMYRLTPDGAAFAEDQARTARAAKTPRPGSRRLAEGPA